MINITAFNGLEFSVVMTSILDDTLRAHLDKGPQQEDLTFALWRPSQGRVRFSAVLNRLVLPIPGDRVLQGNVAFTSEYVHRVLQTATEGYGIALLHSHLGPGWQGMSDDDIVAEKDRLASVVASRTGLPLVGLTRGTDGAWSARFWLRKSPGSYEGRSAQTVRVVGKHLSMTYHPNLTSPAPSSDAQVATVSVWGEKNQARLANVHVGIVGLGSVGSIVAESLSRLGVSRLTLIDHDHIETRNLDRTLGTIPADATMKTPKVQVSERLIAETHTAGHFQLEAHHGSLLHMDGLKRALDCDVLFSCVDRPLPRHCLNAMAYSHLIPVIDGGIFAKVEREQFIHADWRIHTVGPSRPCLKCLGALRSEDVALDLSGKLDDPAYIAGLGPEFSPLIARQNVFPFSLSVAAHEVLQFIGLVTGLTRVGGYGPQMYHAFPGSMEVLDTRECSADCDYLALTASASDLSGNFKI